MKNLSELTIPALFNNTVEKYADKTAVVFVGEKDYTFREMGNDVERVACLLSKQGVVKGDKVAILGTNMPNWGVAFFGISVTGAVAVPILPDFHQNEINTILEHSEARVLFVSSNLYGNLSGKTEELVKSIILIDNFAIIPDGTPSDQIGLLEPSVLPGKNHFTPANIGVEDLASIIYTSGTTGNSKGVMLTHKNLAWNVHQCSSLYQVKSSDRFLSILPLSHTLENTVGFLLPIRHGASIHYLKKPPVASVLLPALQKVQPTIILAVPLIIEKIYRTKILPAFQKNGLIRFLYNVPAFRKILHKTAVGKLLKTFGGKLEFFGIGGAKLDPSTERFLAEGKFPYGIGYGLTETSPLLAGAVVGKTKLGSTGVAVEGVQIRIADPDPVTGEGEIQAKGENIMKGYYKAPEKTQEVFTEDGWFKTGDRGVFDNNNMLFIKGRIKTMIVGASGENIYPEEIESVINKMRFVLESLVLEKKGKLIALIHLNMEEIEENFKHLKSEAKHYITEKSEEILKEIQKKVNAEVNKFSRIQQVILQPLPFEKTPTKKIKRFLYC